MPELIHFREALRRSTGQQRALGTISQSLRVVSKGTWSQNSLFACNIIHLPLGPTDSFNLKGLLQSANLVHVRFRSLSNSVALSHM